MMHVPFGTIDDATARIQKTHDAILDAEPTDRAALQKALQSLVEWYGFMVEAQKPVVTR